MKPLVRFSDVEHFAVDYLTAGLAAHGEDVTVGVDLPADWTPADVPHVAVSHDGTPGLTYPVLAAATLRVTCWAGSTTAAKALAGLCLALLAAYPGGEPVYGINPLTGVLPARDPDNGAPIASVTVRVNAKPQPVN